ncbi:hypothetical protein OC835_003365 [Tilletia horrida]|uniref:Uncharacterized protein n=1 Tax=Tilletia horrida TaxID=155126 RepID=A0AAN6JQP5_9BASI|nr:hypothetical protein OC842_004020 [Tilletia horrida]KAK0532344.1 hypothetical protein OC835_003365 [Tilletia horrida]KAK0560248.1 hypothetical protein OC844_003881 [Tilletia horrida]
MSAPMAAGGSSTSAGAGAGSASSSGKAGSSAAGGAATGPSSSAGGAAGSTSIVSAAAGTGAGAGDGEGEDLPGGPIWAELGSQMPQHSGGRPPNTKVSYKSKFRKARARWEDVTQEQVEHKKSLANAVAKQIKLQDEIK